MGMFGKKVDPASLPFHEHTGVDLVFEVVDADQGGWTAKRTLKEMGIKKLRLGEGSPYLEIVVKIGRTLGTVEFRANGRFLAQGDLETMPQVKIAGHYHFRAWGYIWRSERTARYGVRLHL